MNTIDASAFGCDAGPDGRSAAMNIGPRGSGKTFPTP